MTRKQVFLVGIMKNQITGGKLPSKGDILSVLFYNMRVVNCDICSVIIVIDNGVPRPTRVASNIICDLSVFVAKLRRELLSIYVMNKRMYSMYICLVI